MSLPALLSDPNPTRLSSEQVRHWVDSGVVGAYVLYKDAGDTLKPVYVGRSDTDLRRRLTEHPYSNLDYFDVEVCESPLEAYQLERRLYRWLDPPLNSGFPAYPDDERLPASEEHQKAALQWPVPRFAAEPR